MNSGLAIAAVAASVIFAVAGSALLVHPPRRLGPRVRPYRAGARVDPGVGRGFSGPLPTEVFEDRDEHPSRISSLPDALDRLLAFMDEDRLALRIRQAGLYAGVEEAQRPQVYRMGALGRMVLFGSGLSALAIFVGSGTGLVLVFGLVGLLLGGFLARSRLNEAVKRRRESIRAELYTINQLVALYTKVGGAARESLQYVVDRARGVAIDELAEVLLLHERGWSLREALERAERFTPEPEAARTYRLVATSQEQGSDLAEALLALSRDLRAERRDELRRLAARRRILMVIPVVVVLAPITMLFMAAPIPSIIFG